MEKYKIIKITKASKEFDELFKLAFHKPNLKSTGGKDLFLDLEILSDTLAGPMYSFLEKGTYYYTFKDKEGRFPGVINQETFKKWALNIVNEYITVVNAYVPFTADEKDDKTKLLTIAEAKKDIVYQAEIDNLRYVYDDEIVLIHYIFKNYYHLLTESEIAADRTVFFEEKANYASSKEFKEKLLAKTNSDDLMVVEALSGGVEAFRLAVKNRIIKDHNKNIVINRCPKCNKIVATPRAKLCLWCGYSWFEK